jgi:hypothetical protein
MALLRRFVFNIFVLVLAWCAVTSIAFAQSFSVYVTFDGPHGATPESPVIQGSDGDFYGTTFAVVSTLNAYDGLVTSNMAIVPTTNGSIDAYADGLTHLILDISGYFAP